MKKINNSYSSYISLAAVILTPAIFLVIIYYTSFETITRYSQVTVEIDAENPGIFTYYWPHTNGHYSQSNAINFYYEAGPNSYEVQLPFETYDYPLRIDPGTKDNSITISSIEFKRFDNKQALSPSDIYERVSHTEDASLNLTDSGLKVDFLAGDAKIFLSSYPKVSPSLQFIMITASITAALSILLALLVKRLVTHTNKPYGINVAFRGFIVTPIGLLFHLPFYLCLILPVTTFFIYVALFSSFHLYQSKSSRDFLLQIRPVILSVCFLTLITLPVLKEIEPTTQFTVTVLKDYQELFSASAADNTHENRVKTFRDSFEKTFISLFPFKEDLIELNANIKIFGLGFSPSAKAIVGQDGMFFEGYGERRIETDAVGSFDNITDYMGMIPFSEDELKQWLVCLEERYYWLKEHGIDYIFVLAPTKALIYPEKLPPRILKMKNEVNKPTRYRQLVNYLKTNSTVPVVDLQTPFLAAKQQQPDPLLYYKTDFHWNYYGSFLAYQAIIEEINKAYPKYNLTPHPLDEFTIQVKPDWVHRRFITMLGLDPDKHQNEPYLTFMPNKGSIYNSIANFSEKGISDYSIPDYLPKMFGKTKIRKLTNPLGEIPSVFVIGDSFSEKYFGYFSGNAQETFNFRTVYSFFPDIFLKFSPNIVVQEVLNMYLLQDPPGNTDDIKQARVRALAKSPLSQEQKN